MSSSRTVRARLHGGGGPRIGEVTCGESPYLCNYCTEIFVIVVNTCVFRRSVDNEALILSYPILTCKRDQIKMRDYMDRRVTPSKRVTSPTWGPQPPCKRPQMSHTVHLIKQISTSKASRLRVNLLSQVFSDKIHRRPGLQIVQTAHRKVNRKTLSTI